MCLPEDLYILKESIYFHFVQKNHFILENIFFRFEGDSAAAYLNRLYCYWNQITFARIRNSITYIKWVVFANTSCATQFNIITCYLLVWRLYRKLNNIWIVYLELICSLARFNHIEMIESQSVFVTREKDLIIQ